MVRLRGAAGIRACDGAVVKPPISLLDKRFVYTPSHATEIRRTFERIRRELREQKQANVTPIKRKDRG